MNDEPTNPPSGGVPAAPEDSDLRPLAAAAQAAGVKKRTAYRRVEEGVVPAFKDEDGRTLVSVAALRAYRDTGTAARGTPPSGTRDGKLDADVFRLLDEGRTPAEIVVLLEAPTGPVMAAVKRQREMQEFARKPSVPDRIAAVEKGLDELRSQVEAAATETTGMLLERQDRSARLETAVGEWRQWVQSVENRLAAFEEALRYLYPFDGPRG